MSSQGKPRTRYSQHRMSLIIQVEDAGERHRVQTSDYIRYLNPVTLREIHRIRETKDVGRPLSL